MAIIRRPLKRSAQALAVLVWVFAAPALACSRETSATVDPGSLFATTTVAPRPVSPTPSATMAVTDTRTSVPLPSVTPRPSNTFPHTPTLHPRATPLPVGYLSQAGDTLRTIAIRFGVVPGDIQAVGGESLPVDGLLEPGTQLIIPVSLTDTSESSHLFPDSAIVYSPAFANFDPIGYVHGQGGYLAAYIQGSGDIANGAEILRQISFNNSFSPKLLMALIEYESGWITQASPPADTLKYPLGNKDPDAMGLTAQLIWATNILSIGYYGWRDASVLELGFADGGTLRLAPDLNAGTVDALMLTALPVRGSRHSRAARFRASKLPNPLMATFPPRRSSEAMIPVGAKNSSAISFALALVRPSCLATAATSSRLFTRAP